MLEKGVVWIEKDKFDIYLKERICDEDRLSLERIVEYCFKYKASIAFLFIDCKNGNYSCPGYMPIFDNEDTLEQNNDFFESIEQSIFLGAFFINNASELEDEELLSVMKKRASRLGFWHEDYAILVLR